jgi:hypothetical protein
MRTKFERTRSACITPPLHQKCGGAFLQTGTAYEDIRQSCLLDELVKALQIFDSYI